MKLAQLIRSFAGGEITPELYGRLDLDKFQTGLEKALNFIPLPHGAVIKRPGFAYVNRGGDVSKKIRVIPFAYSATQTMVLEFGDQYIRFHTDGGTLLETAKNITGITQPAGVVTSNSHGYSNGDWVYLDAIVGMTELNERFAVVSDSAANTFRLKDFDGNYITTGSYGAYVSGGTVARVYKISSPYVEADLFDLHYTQNADVLTITHPGYAPRSLSRVSATSWTLAATSFTQSFDSPGSVSAAATVGAGAKEYAYAVSAISGNGVQESPVAVSSTGASANITGAGTGLTPRKLYSMQENTKGEPQFITWYVTLSSVTGLRPGMILKIASTVGLTGINDKSFKIHSISGSNVYLVRTDGSPTTGIGGTWTSGGTAVRPYVTNDLATAGNYNTVTWAAVDGALRYKIYKKDTNSGLMGYIGETEETAFIDDNIIPDVTRTPPESLDPFTGADDYPTAVAYFEQRRCFGGTTNNPQYVWLTKSGAEADFTASYPPNDADAFSFRIASRQNNMIRHLVSLYDLFALTAGGEFRLSSSSGDDPLTVRTVNPRPISYVGASNVQPATTQGSVLYFADAGSHLHELSPSGEIARSYGVNDMSLLAPHLVDGYTITDLAFQRSPVPVLWAVRNDGRLLGFTYLPEQRVLAWHSHSTNGTFESVCVVKEGAEDRVYAVVKRNIDGSDVRYIERMAPLRTPSNTGSFYVDAGSSYNGAATTTISGLWHLEGEEVAVLADGADHLAQTVTNGEITLDQEASVVHVGLQYNADLKTLPLTLESAPAAGVGIMRNINAVRLRVHNSRGLFVGTDFDHLYENKERTTETYGSPPALQSELVEVPIDGDWNYDGAVCVRSSAPLPLTILAMAIDVGTEG